MINTSNYFINTQNSASTPALPTISYNYLNSDSQTSVVVFSSIGATLNTLFVNNTTTLSGIISAISNSPEKTYFVEGHVRGDSRYAE